MELIDYEGELDRLRCRDYQKNAVIAAINAWEGCRSTLIVLPTGCGKTVIGSSLCRLWEQHKKGRVLWIAHRKELIEQAASSISRFTGTNPEIEMADQQAEQYSLLADSSVVVASIQSLMAGRKCKACDATGGILDVCPKCHGEGCGDSKCEGRGSIATDADCPFCLGGRIRRLQKFRPEEFSLIVVDECHHATSSTHRRVQKWFQRNENAKLLGLTATADRLDGAALGQVFQTVAVNIELPWAIDNGWLVPITQKSITCEHLDFTNVRTTAGDLNGRDLEDILATEETLHEMVAPTVELAGERRTLVFCVDKTHTKLVCELINRYKPGSANYILGDTNEEERVRIITEHKTGKFQYMVGCGVFTEGYDDPGIQVVAIMRPTKSRALYCQCLDSQTEILTESGWRTHETFSGERVAAFDTQTDEIRWSHGEKVSRLLGNEAMYGIQNPHCDIRVTSGHRMVESHKIGRKKIRSSWQFKEACSMPPCFEIPVAGTTSIPDADISDSDITFLGLLLTDGHCNKHNKAITFTQCDKYQDTVELIESTIIACGFKFGKHKITQPSNFGERSPLNIWTISCGEPRGADKHLTGWRRLSKWVSDGKTLTPYFETLSVRQAEVLVKALYAGNGAKICPDTWTKHTLDISVANSRLADQLQSLLVRRGFRCNITPTESKCVMLHTSKKSRWSFVKTACDGRPIWGILPSNPNEIVWCVTVDTGAIVTRRNGKVAIVGNCVGRGTRPIDPPTAETPEERKAAIAASTKPSLLILDYVGNAGRHKLITALNLFEGKYSDDILDRAKRIADEADEELPTEELVRRAQEQIDEEERKRQELEEARKREWMKAREVKFNEELVDPFGWWDTLPQRIGAAKKGRQATDNQINALLRMGVEPLRLEELSFSEASVMMNTLVERRKKGLCTYKQSKHMLKHNINPDVSFTTASRIMDAIARNGWKCNDSIREMANQQTQEASR